MRSGAAADRAGLRGCKVQIAERSIDRRMTQPTKFTLRPNLLSCCCLHPLAAHLHTKPLWNSRNRSMSLQSVLVFVRSEDFAHEKTSYIELQTVHEPNIRVHLPLDVDTNPLGGKRMTATMSSMWMPYTSADVGRFAFIPDSAPGRAHLSTERLSEPQLPSSLPVCKLVLSILDVDSRTCFVRDGLSGLLSTTPYARCVCAFAAQLCARRIVPWMLVRVSSPLPFVWKVSRDRRL